MIYNVRYFDLTAAGYVYNEDITIEKEYSEEEQGLLENELKERLIEKLRCTVNKSNIIIKGWTKVQ